jgi:hypothetical protein
VDFAKPIHPRQGNRDGVIGTTISNAPPPLGNDLGEHGGMPSGAD